MRRLEADDNAAGGDAYEWAADWSFRWAGGGRGPCTGGLGLLDYHGALLDQEGELEGSEEE